MRVRGRQAQGGMARSGLTQSAILMLSCFACFYVAGRLWQDAQKRAFLIRLLEQNKDVIGTKVITENEQLNLSDCKQNQKRLAELEMELVAARSSGFSQRPTPEKRNITAVIGINTGLGNHMRRHSIRARWMPSGRDLRKLEEEKAIVIRFVVGRSANRGDSSDRAIDAENLHTDDFLILETHVETAEEFSGKAKEFFSTAFELWNAEFYIRVDDDVFIDIDNLSELLATYSHKQRAYFGCMKSGDVVTVVGQRWYESEWWKFGDKKSYFQHASSQIYGITTSLAQYIYVNREVLHAYAHEDISVGSWMLGLDIEHVDERRFCCNNPSKGAICSLM